MKEKEEIEKLCRQLLSAQLLKEELDKAKIKWRKRKWKLQKGKTICVPKTRRPPKEKYYSILKKDNTDLRHCELCGSDYRTVVQFCRDKVGMSLKITYFSMNLTL